MRSIAGLAASLLLGGCSVLGGTVIDPNAYGRSCTADADCAVAFTGDACAPCAGCPNTAISASRATEALADLAASRAACLDWSDVACGPCEPAVAHCQAGTCALLIGP